MTVKEASCSGPELPTTRHTYSPESAWETWWSRSREPWVCRSEERVAIVPEHSGQGKYPSPAVPVPKSSQELRAPAGGDEEASFTESYKSTPSPFQR